MTDVFSAQPQPRSTDAALAAQIVVSNAPESIKPRFPKLLGFRDGTSTVHTSRTMMLSELSLLLEKVDTRGKVTDYLTAIVQQNVLGKATQTTRQKTAQRLAELYGLDTNQPLFRAVREFWSDVPSRSFIAFLTATARDPLLRDTSSYLLSIPIGNKIDPKDTGKVLAEKYPDRFSPTTLRSTAQNLASSWRQAGLVTGKLKKIRTMPVVTPVTTTFAIFLGYLCGVRGKLLLDTIWTRLLNRSAADLFDLATEASKRGWLNFKAAGAVVEITFPGLLTAQEEKMTYESD